MSGTGTAPALAIRRAGVADAAALAVLNAEVQALHATHRPALFKPAGAVRDNVSATAAWFAKPQNLVFIAESGGSPVGYAYAEILRRPETPYTYAFDSLTLHHIGVAPAARRAGVGRALLAAVRAAGREAGIDLVTLDVWHFNAEALAFYRRAGFQTRMERLWSS